MTIDFDPLLTPIPPMLEPPVDPAFEAFSARVNSPPPQNDIGIELLNIALGICLAGGAYPALVTIGATAVWSVMFVLQLLNGSTAIPDVGDLLVYLMILPVIAAVCGVIGFIWTSIVTLFILPVFYLIAKSLHLASHPIWLGAGCGGLVGMMAFAPVWMDWPRFSSIHNSLFLLAIGPGLTTVLGQAGGAWGGRRVQLLRASRAEWEKTLVEAGGWSGSIAETTVEGPDESALARPPVFQFRIWHLLWISVWLSLLLTGMRLLEIPLEIALPAIAAWVVYQAATLFWGGRAVRWYRERQAHARHST